MTTAMVTVIDPTRTLSGDPLDNRPPDPRVYGTGISMHLCGCYDQMYGPKDKSDTTVGASIRRFCGNWAHLACVRWMRREWIRKAMRVKVVLILRGEDGRYRELRQLWREHDLRPFWVRHNGKRMVFARGVVDLAFVEKVAGRAGYGIVAVHPDPSVTEQFLNDVFEVEDKPLDKNRKMRASEDFWEGIEEEDKGWLQDTDMDDPCGPEAGNGSVEPLLDSGRYESTQPKEGRVLVPMFPLMGIAADRYRKQLEDLGYRSYEGYTRGVRWFKWPPENGPSPKTWPVPAR